MKKTFLIYVLLFVPVSCLAIGNTTITSFNKAKKELLQNVYFDHHETFYCKANFENNYITKLPNDFITKKYVNRLNVLEWDHIVPAELFGNAFYEWENGHNSCIDGKGKKFIGRKCAKKVNVDFKLMVSDMYNLYPSIGTINALRLNYNFTEFPITVLPYFEGCSIKINNKLVEPPEYTRGSIARTYLYFEDSYPMFKMDLDTRSLMIKWNNQYPVDDWECERARRIEKVQGNANKYVKEMCE